jgi:serine/threonine protein kinase/formylglycine-generating enzyme required for sulfatase activity
MGKKKLHNALIAGYKLHWYTIKSVLGRGGFGITYLAEDTNLNRLVAIKEFLPIDLGYREEDDSIQPIISEDEEPYRWGLERFISEAQTLVKFDHHNIVKVIAVFEANNTGYMVMHYEEGRELQDLLNERKTLNESEILKILIPLIAGLEKVHDTGFIHRDIKPQNILIRTNGSPILIDFGSARQALGNKTQTLTSLVSPGYAPFEQYHSKSDKQGPWTDIYALAATAYRCILGKQVLNAVDRSDAIFHGAGDNLVSAEEIGKGNYSSHFLKAIDHGLMFKTSDRPQSLPEWKQEFKKIKRPKRLFYKNEDDIKTEESLSIKLHDINSLDEVQKPRTEPQISKLFITVTTSIIIVLASLLYLYGNPEILIDKEQPEEKILTTQEELEKRRKELVLLEKKVEAERIREEKKKRLEEERKRKIAEEKAKKIKEVEEKQEQIDLLLAKANVDIEANRLTSPKDNNAYDKYQKVLELSLEHTGANDGIAKIGNIFIAEANLAIEKKDFKRASKLINEANKITPDSKDIKLAKYSLASAKEKEKTAEEKRIAAENSRKIEEEKQQNIKALLTLADEDIKAKRLISPNKNNAFTNYKKILEISPKHTGAMKGLVNVSILLAAEIQAVIDEKDFLKADIRIQEAVEIFPNSNDIKEVQKALVAARLEAKKEKARLGEKKRIAAEKERKIEEEKQKRIKVLMARADADIKAKRLIKPKDDNALGKYNEVLEQIPEHTGATEGIINIANALIGESEVLAEKKDFIEADKYLNEAVKLNADPEKIKQVRNQLDKARTEDRKEKVGELLVQANEALKAREFESVKSLLKEATILDPESKDLKLFNQSYEQQYSKWQEEKKRAEEIKQLLAAAQKNIESKRLTTPKSNNALDQYRKVLELEPDNTEAKGGVRQIFNRYIELAQRADEEEIYEKAQTYITKANEIIPNQAEALDIIDVLKPKLAEIEKIKEEAEKKAEQERLAKEEEEKLKQLAEQERLKNEAEALQLAEVEAAKQKELKRLEDEEAANKAKNTMAGEFVEIPGGTFNTSGKTVTVDTFKLAKQMVTIGEWKKVVGKSAVYQDKCDECAMTTVTRSMALDYINKLNSASKQTYRLPTAAEWLYACKKGGNTKECDGRNISGAYLASSDLVNVKNEKLDQLGLQGMGGKVYEMTCSKYSERYKSDWLKCLDSADNNISVIFGNKKNMATDSYNYWAQNVHNWRKNNNTGFRLVLD